LTGFQDLGFANGSRIFLKIAAMFSYRGSWPRLRGFWRRISRHLEPVVVDAAFLARVHEMCGRWTGALATVGRAGALVAIVVAYFSDAAGAAFAANAAQHFIFSSDPNWIFCHADCQALYRHRRPRCCFANAARGDSMSIAFDSARLDAAGGKNLLTRPFGRGVGSHCLCFPPPRSGDHQPTALHQA